uniref:FLYWCH-type domain-containing protein n=1 Tax=Anopheles maculatus TaxID=74869 RepID=A0A182SZ93_9DIPT
MFYLNNLNLLSLISPNAGKRREVEYIVTSRGGLQLSIDNFRFARDRIQRNVVTYRCVHYRPLGCTARAKTYGPDRKLEIIADEHNHPAYMHRHNIPTKVDSLKATAVARRGKRELQKANDAYGYNQRGNLVYHNFSFSKANINGAANIIYWRCTEYRKHRCCATLKTKGKDLYVIDTKHNHEPKKYGPIMPATLPIFNPPVDVNITPAKAKRAAPTPRVKRELEKANDAYTYNQRGNLVYHNFSFSKASINGVANIIYWRCTEYRKHRCCATLKTKGEDLYLIDAKHNHEPKKYGRWPVKIPNVYVVRTQPSGLVIDLSNELTRKLPDVTLFKTKKPTISKRKGTTGTVSASSLLMQRTSSTVLGDSVKKSKLPATVEVVKPNVNTVKTLNNTRPNLDDIVKQLSNGHTLVKLVKTRVRGFCVCCIRKIQDPEYKKKLQKVITGIQRIVSLK